LYILPLSNINRLFIVNQKKICNNTTNPTTPQMYRYTTLCFVKAPQHGVSLITPLLNGVAGLNASFSSKTDT